MTAQIIPFPTGKKLTMPERKKLRERHGKPTPEDVRRTAETLKLIKAYNPFNYGDLTNDR